MEAKKQKYAGRPQMEWGPQMTYVNAPGVSTQVSSSLLRECQWTPALSTADCVRTTCGTPQTACGAFIGRQDAEVCACENQAQLIPGIVSGRAAIDAIARMRSRRGGWSAI